MNVACGLSTVALGVVDEAWGQWQARLHFRAAKKDFVWSPSNEAPRAPSPWDRLAFARRVDSRSTEKIKAGERMVQVPYFQDKRCGDQGERRY